MSDTSTDTLIRTEKLGRCKCEHCGVMLDIAEFRVFEELQCPDCGGINTVPGKLGDFTLLRELGRGGMGSVFLAVDAHLGRKVALKVLNARFGKNPVFVDSLLREAKAAATLNHRNIVHIYTFGQMLEQPFIVMELVDGIRLDEVLQADVSTDEEGWLGLMEQICNALIAAQSAGLVHGDIKPANILMNEKGVAKLSDFGIARFQGELSDRILGTPLYIAPEKARGLKVDHRADQFSLGATFWHLFTRQLPFNGADARAIMLNRFEITPPDPRKYAPHLSEGCARLLMRMMAVKPEERHSDFRAVRREIQKIMQTLEDRRREKEAAEAESRRLEQEEAAKQRVRWITLAAGAGALIIAFLFLMIFR